MSNEQSVKCATNTPSGVGDRFIAPVSWHNQIYIFALPNMYIHIIAHAYPHYQIRVSVSTHTHFHIIKYVHSHHRTHISVCHFVGVYVFAGTINRTPTAANGLPFRCWRSAITLRTPTKYTQNTPQNTNKHSVKCQRTIREMRNEHSARYQQTFREIPSA